MKFLLPLVIKIFTGIIPWEDYIDHNFCKVNQGVLAQRVEQVSDEEKVTGSSPVYPTIILFFHDAKGL